MMKLIMNSAVRKCVDNPDYYTSDPMFTTGPLTSSLSAIKIDILVTVHKK